MDDGGELIPEWWFLFGVVDSEILPLNIFRVLCGRKALRVFKMHLVKKCLDMLAEIGEKIDVALGT